MIIGVDAYFLFEKNNTGIGTLNLNLLRELSKIDDANTYILFTPGVFHNKAAEEIVCNKNFKIVVSSSLFSGSRRLWLQSPVLRQRILREKIEVFWGGGEYFPVWLPKRVKCVVTIHDLVFILYPETITIINKIIYYTLFRMCVKRASAIITISNDSKNDITRYLKTEGKKVFVVPNGIYVSEFKPVGKEKKRNYILFVGTLQPRKNLINVIRAFDIIAHSMDVELVVVGASGWKNNEIRYVIEKLEPGIVNKIKFMGYVDDKSLKKLYQEALVFVAPSLHEGFGLIMLEAMASGTPVVTSRRGAIPEIFGDFVEYADPLSPQDIANKIAEIIFDYKKRRMMIDKALSFVKKYDIRKTAQQYIDIFKQI